MSLERRLRRWAGRRRGGGRGPIAAQEQADQGDWSRLGAGLRGRGLLRRGALAASLTLLLLVIGWWSLHRSPAFAAFVVNTARGALGPRAIAWLEDRAYQGEDAVKRATSSSEPVRYWEPEPAHDPAPAASSAPAAGRTQEGFPPPPFAAPHEGVALPDDGRWTPIVDRFGEVTMAKAMVHPDPRRPFAAAAVVAFDLRKVDLGIEPGTNEPVTAALPKERKRGVVPQEARPRLLAAFNGGFMTVHGRWGMMVDGVALVPPRSKGCTLARYRDGTLRIATWKQIAGDVGEMTFFRQAPPCLVESGVENPEVDADDQEWGAAVGGFTFIRRSAFGLDASGKVGFYAIGDSLTVTTIGRALLSAGAKDVIELDVNWAYPKLFFYEGGPEDAPRIRSSLLTAYGWTPETYVDRPDWRDFFFVVRR